jgi:hypothetical protein
MFPTSIEGRFALPSSTPEQADDIASRIVVELRQVRATDIQREGSSITFGGGMFRRVGNWNLLVPVGHGVIEVHAGVDAEVRFRFSCVQALVITTLMVAFVVAIMNFGSSTDLPIAFRLGAPAFMWLWLFGMNYAIAAARLPRFVRRAASANGGERGR